MTLAELMEQNQEIGFEKGLEQGLKQGLEKGLSEGKLEIAQKMISEGYDFDVIEKLTGIDKETLCNN